MSLSFQQFGILAGVLAIVIVASTAASWRDLLGTASREDKVTASFVFVVGLLVSLPTFLTGILDQRALRLDDYGRLISISALSPAALERYTQVLLLLISISLIARNLHRDGVGLVLEPRALIAFGAGLSAVFASAIAGERVVSLSNALFLAVLACCCTLKPTVAALRGAALYTVFVAALSGAVALFYPDQTIVTCERKCSAFGMVYYGLFLNENAAGLVFALGVGLCFYAFSGWPRVGIIGCLLISVLATGSRTSIAAALITIATFALFQAAAKRADVVRSPTSFFLSKQPVLRGLVSLAMLSWPAVVLSASYFDALTGRPALWKVATQYFLASPLYGWGASRWVTNSHQGLVDTSARYSAHNQALDILFVGGAVGLIAFAYIAASAMWSKDVEVASSSLALMVPTALIGFTERAMAIGSLDWLSFTYIALILVCGSGRRPVANVSDTAGRSSIGEPLAR